MGEHYHSVKLAMKYSILMLAAVVSSVIGFTPVQPTVKTITTELAAKKVPKKTEKRSLFKTISEMDLYAPFSTRNEFGARDKKNLKLGTINPKKSYVPSGLTAAQYSSLRNKEKKEKDARYQKAKKNTFVVFTDWYKKRGTDTTDKWMDSVTGGHTFVKTKYDWQADAYLSFQKKDKKKK